MLIVFLAFIGSIIGGMLGFAIAYYLITKNIQSSVNTQVEPSQPKADTLLTRVIEEIKKETRNQTRRVGESEKVLTSQNPNPSQTEQNPNPSQTEGQSQSIVIVEQTQQPSLPKEEAKVPQTETKVTIDLSSNLPTNTSLNRPSTPSITPEIKPTIGGLNLSMETLKEEDVKKVYYEEGNISKAERMVNDALSKNPNDQVAKKYARMIKLEKNALSLEAQGDIEGARKVWKEILSVDPNHPRAKVKAQ